MSLGCREADVFSGRSSQALFEKKLSLRLNLAWAFNSPVIEEWPQGSGDEFDWCFQLFKP